MSGGHTCTTYILDSSNKDCRYKQPMCIIGVLVGMLGVLAKAQIM